MSSVGPCFFTLTISCGSCGEFNEIFLKTIVLENFTAFVLFFCLFVFVHSVMNYRDSKNLHFSALILGCFLSHVIFLCVFPYNRALPSKYTEKCVKS